MLVVSDFGPVNSIGVHKTPEGIKIWGSIAPRIMRNMMIPQIVGPTPSLVIGSENITKMIFHNGILQILRNDGILLHIDILHGEGQPSKIAENVNDIVHNAQLINNNKIVFPDQHTEIKLYTTLINIYSCDYGVWGVSTDMDLWFISFGGIVVRVHQDICKIKEGDECLYFFSNEELYVVRKANPTISIHVEALSEFVIVCDNLALTSAGNIARWSENLNIEDYYDIPERIIDIHSYKGSYFAEGVSGTMWVWGCNANQRLGLQKHIEFVEQPIRNKYI